MNIIKSHSESLSQVFVEAKTNPLTLYSLLTLFPPKLHGEAILLTSENIQVLLFSHAPTMHPFRVHCIEDSGVRVHRGQQDTVGLSFTCGVE